MKTISSWGRLTAQPHETILLTDQSSVTTILARNKPGIAYGMGRSYGDICLNAGGTVWQTRGLNRLIAFDADTGRLTCESGVLLRDLQHYLLPRGWSLPVTPGTLWVTVGGAIANDVHGKNYHQYGTFGQHIHECCLHRTDGETIICGPHTRSDWFFATVGGMGLTGVLSMATLQLKRVESSCLEIETVVFESLAECFALSQDSEREWEEVVSWIDGSRPNRGILMRARPSQNTLPMKTHRLINIPFVFPFSCVNRLTVPALNQFYFYLKKRRLGTTTCEREQFLYPLDRILNWNHLYGPRGFYQYQVLLHFDVAIDALSEIFLEIKRAAHGSFLTVLKQFSTQFSSGMMSFVRPGVTFSIDFDNRGKVTKDLLKRLHAIAQAANGRIYLAKDASMSPALFAQSYPNVQQFLAYRDPGMCSDLSRRLGL